VVAAGGGGLGPTTAAGGSRDDGVPSDDVHCVVPDDPAVPDGEWKSVPLD
jgi:hypothetical protein